MSIESVGQLDLPKPWDANKHQQTVTQALSALQSHTNATYYVLLKLMQYLKERNKKASVPCSSKHCYSFVVQQLVRAISPHSKSHRQHQPHIRRLGSHIAPEHFRGLCSAGLQNGATGGRNTGTTQSHIESSLPNQHPDP